METYNVTIIIRPRTEDQREFVVVDGLTLDEARQALLDRFNGFATKICDRRFATWDEATRWEGNEDLRAYTTSNDLSRGFFWYGHEAEIRRDRDEE